MANAQVATAFLTPTAVTASTSATDHAAALAAVIGKPLRTWRSTGATVGSEHLTLNFGAAKSPPAAFLDNVNFATFKLQQSSNGTTFTDVTGVLTTGTDARVGRRKRIVTGADFSTAPTQQYLRVLPQTAPDNSGTYFEVGTFCGVAALTTWAQNPRAWTYTVQEAATVSALLGGGLEINRDGVPYLTYQLDLVNWRHDLTSMAELLALATLGKGVPLLIHENRGVPQSAYLMKRGDPIPVAEAFRVFDGQLALVECF